MWSGFSSRHNFHLSILTSEAPRCQYSKSRAHLFLLFQELFSLIQLSFDSACSSFMNLVPLAPEVSHRNGTALNRVQKCLNFNAFVHVEVHVLQSTNELVFHQMNSKPVTVRPAHLTDVSCTRLTLASFGNSYGAYCATNIPKSSLTS